MQVPQPFPNETQEDYTIRAHRELMGTVTDPMERNRVVWNAWDTQVGDVERHRAESVFPEEKFEHRRDVCLWHEHEAATVGPDGQPAVKVNDVNRLRDIVRENNLRIADTDAYTALVDKHTMPGNQRDPLPPRTLGFVGPYRLGMIGRVNPRFAIFGDEHHRRDESKTLADRPRRSVEVLTLRANGRSYLDPIAALSEAPRLPLPVHYSATDDDRGEFYVDRYQAEPVAAFPGGSNGYIPNAGNGTPKDGGHISGRNKTYTDQFGAVSNDPNDDNSTESTSMLTPEDLKQIADAMMQTPQMQFITQLMQQGGQGGQPGGEPSPQGPPQEPPQSPPHQGPPQGPPQHAAPKEPYIAPALAGMAGGMMANRFGATEEDDYEIEGDDMDNELAEKYSALAESQGRLLQRVAEVSRRNAALEQKAADAERKQAIAELYNAYPHMVDVEAEHSRCLYSAGSVMDDDQFASHCELIEQYASKAPAIAPMVPSGELPRQSRGTSEKYEAQIALRSVEIYNAALQTGQMKTSDECWAEAEREIGQPA
jgi:hypothetical protein